MSEDFNVAGLSPQVLRGVMKAVGVDLNELQTMQQSKTICFFRYSEKIPEGKIFKCLPEHEAQIQKEMEADGWVDTPAKLKNPCPCYEKACEKVSTVPEMMHPKFVSTVDNDGTTAPTVKQVANTTQAAPEETVETPMEEMAQVLDLIGNGKDNKDIARELGIHHKTVEKIRRENS